jgi:hypothetical protein
MGKKLPPTVPELMPPPKPPKVKRPPGRPAFVPTKEQRNTVAMLSGFGIPHEGICQLVKHEGEPISRETLQKYFRADLDRGVHEANTKVAGSLFKAAIDQNNVGAMIFWLKTRARWKETPQQVAFTDPDGNPAPPPSLADFYATVEVVGKGGGNAGDTSA